MRKILYLIEQPLDERNFERYGIQRWLDRGWAVEIWDLTPLTYPAVWRNFLDSNGRLRQFAGYFPLASKGELAARYSALGKVGYFIDFTGESYQSLRAKVRLILRGAKRVICAPGSIPAPDAAQQPGTAQRLRAILAKGPVSAIGTLGMALARRLLAPTIRPGLAVVSGKNSIMAAGKAGEILEAHSFDYDIYLRVARRQDEALAPTRYAVFIDQDLCFHSDFIGQGIPFVVTPQRYFPAVCACLRKISEDLRLQLRIAAHPRARYFQRHGDYFEGIPIEYGKTAELIRDCEVVVCHDSTAIHFAVLFGKPLLFVTSDELIPSYEGRSIAQAAAALGKSAVNLDRPLGSLDWGKELQVDPEKYREYKNKYIKLDGSPERPMWEVIIDHVEKSEKKASVQLAAQCATDGGGR
jgi:hypothetical protein